MADPIYWIWYSLVFGCGTRRAAEVMQALPDPETLWNMSPRERYQSGRLTPAELQRLERTPLEEAAGILDRAEALGCTVLTPDHSGYPDRLRYIYGPPATLYVLGHPRLLDAPMAIGMVGSRRCSDYGRRMGDRFSRTLAAAGAVVVSGMANGIDQVCHTGAIKAGGGTVGVLGCGVDYPYPKGSETMRELMIGYGALVSEYPPGTEPSPQRFPVRNRILTGLCRGILVVEAGIRSGSLVSAGLALSQGRDVFVLPGRVDEENTAGINLLLRQGAIPACQPGDILEEYPDWQPAVLELRQEQPPEPRREEPVPAKPAKARLPDYLSGEQRQLCEALTSSPQTADALSDRTGLPIHQVLAALTQLEIFGLAKPLGGRTFTIA